MERDGLFANHMPTFPMIHPHPPEDFMPQSYRALIAAPPGLMRRSLWAVLTTFSEIVLIGDADDCLSAQQMSQALKPDILLISADLPENEVEMLLRGFDEAGRYKPYTIVFVNISGQRYRALAAGASSVLWQSDSTRQLAMILKQFQMIQTSAQPGN